MELIIIGIVITIILALLFVKAKSKQISPDYSYLKKEVLFTPAERSFLGVLNQAIGNEVQIFGKVRVADVLTPKKGISRSSWQKAFNKISAKHFDFVLCDKQDLSIICVVELDDSSHQSKNRKERDVFLVGACNSSSLPLVQVPAQSSYNMGEIRELLSLHIKKVDIEDVSHGNPTKVVGVNKNCPKCSSVLVQRVAKKGKNTGQEFIACSSYPKCRYIEVANA